LKKINPYPGLRPFTEKESIFFKGRDLHIRQIIKQLQDKKIIIITGASGDGKSSLVYAGVIPNARAGFFRAEYNNWVICDFRPERTPLHNLSKTLSENLEIPVERIEEDLKLGFSSLIKTYKNSNFYIDKNSETWINASPEEQRKMKSKGANLMILADQFEEFFTNPENYAGGVPSDDAYVTVNLLLESAGLAIVENLPVYIIFTMRSDFY
jgi:energy-coupling factor transporter ATP-binding protein EcfA2